MAILYNILITLSAFLLMEAVAWLAHKYVMHGFLWKLHKSHHQPDEKSPLEKNDFFFLIFATPAILFFLLGFKEFNHFFWIAVGITLYGAS